MNLIILAAGCLVVLLGSMFMNLAGPVWIAILLLWSIVVAARSSSRVSLRIVIPVVCAGLIVAHAKGYKVIGSAHVFDNSPVLRAPVDVSGFKHPNIATTTSGAELLIKGIRFRENVDSSGFAWAVKKLNRGGDSIQVELGDSPSGLYFQRARVYWCGNTFYPRFFPSRLPRYDRSDFGETLVMMDLATPVRVR